MRPAQDYLTLLQLAVGLNLVIGAYGSYRKGVESKIESELDLSRTRIDEIISAEPESNLPIADRLEKRRVKDLDARELARYLGDTSIRFHKRSSRFARRDGVIEPFLMPIGLFCLALLFYASWWPKTQVSYKIVYPACIIAFLPALWSYMRLVIEVREHNRYYHREANASYREKSEEGQARRVKSSPLEGEITRVMNEVRKRYKIFSSQRHKATKP